MNNKVKITGSTITSNVNKFTDLEEENDNDLEKRLDQ